MAFSSVSVVAPSLLLYSYKRTEFGLEEEEDADQHSVSIELQELLSEADSSPPTTNPVIVWIGLRNYFNALRTANEFQTLHC
jgi:hypothetical protein